MTAAGDIGQLALVVGGVGVLGYAKYRAEERFRLWNTRRMLRQATDEVTVPVIGSWPDEETRLYGIRGQQGEFTTVLKLDVYPGLPAYGFTLRDLRAMPLQDLSTRLVPSPKIIRVERPPEGAWTLQNRRWFDWEFYARHLEERGNPTTPYRPPRIIVRLKESTP